MHTAQLPNDLVMVLGDYYLDIIITGLPELPRLGADLFGSGLGLAPGGGFIPATGLQRLGVPCAWVADLGNDLISQWVLAAARTEGLDERFFRVFDYPIRKLSVAFSYAYDRGFISYVDPSPWRLPLEWVRSAHPAWVMYIPFNGDAQTLEFVAEVHAYGGKVYLDSQHTGDLTLATPGIQEILAEVDVFTCNHTEAQALTGAAEPRAALEMLAALTHLAVIKCGAAGAYAQLGGQVLHSPAIPVQAVDTTGAGDSFNAGFVAALRQDLTLEACLRYGNICGGLSTTRPGGAAAAPTLTELQAWL